MFLLLGERDSISVFSTINIDNELLIYLPNTARTRHKGEEKSAQSIRRRRKGEGT